MAVKRGLDDLKCFADSDEGLTFESAAYELDDIFGQVRKVGEGTLSDLLPFPPALA